MFAPLGDEITVEDLIQGVTVQSANDGALILAEGIGGTEQGFVKMMNDYAEADRSHPVDLHESDGLEAEVSSRGAGPCDLREISDRDLSGILSRFSQRSSAIVTSSPSGTAIRWCGRISAWMT